MAKAVKTESSAATVEAKKLKALKKGRHNGKKSYEFKAGDIVQPIKADYDLMSKLAHFEVI